VIDGSACKAGADRVMTRAREGEGIVSLEYILQCSRGVRIQVGGDVNEEETNREKFRGKKPLYTLVYFF
jgi:hypothetical protein